MHQIITQDRPVARHLIEAAPPDIIVIRIGAACFVHIQLFLAVSVHPGDTVRIVEYRDKYIYRYKTIRDTLVRADSVAVETVREVKVEKPLSWSQRAKLGLFWPFVFAALGLAFWVFRKPILGLFTKIGKLIF